MSASLVGSEMCIRDSAVAAPAGPQARVHCRPYGRHRERAPLSGWRWAWGAGCAAAEAEAGRG
eukprot:337470-Alexandrium_andersonii.AAC.1